MATLALVALSIAILAAGIFCFLFVVNRYQEKLLANFSQKIWMTAWLALVFGALFVLSNYFMVRVIDQQKIIANLQDYRNQPWFLIKVGLAYFILNACLIMAFRSMIKTMYRYWKAGS